MCNDCSAFISALEGAFAKWENEQKVGECQQMEWRDICLKYGFTKDGGEEPSALARSGQLVNWDILVGQPGHYTSI